MNYIQLTKESFRDQDIEEAKFKPYTQYIHSIMNSHMVKTKTYANNLKKDTQNI